VSDGSATSAVPKAVADVALSRLLLASHQNQASRHIRTALTAEKQKDLFNTLSSRHTRTTTRHPHIDMGVAVGSKGYGMMEPTVSLCVCLFLSLLLDFSPVLIA
jgi:hypothetical protein